MKQSIRIPGRPWGLNAERSGHWRTHRERTRTVRELAHWTAIAERLKPMQAVDVVVECEMCHPMLDTGSNLPTVKAIIDGLVDAGVLPNDTPEFVRSVLFCAPRRLPKGGEQCTIVHLHDAGERK